VLFKVESAVALTIHASGRAVHTLPYHGSDTGTQRTRLATLATGGNAISPVLELDFKNTTASAQAIPAKKLFFRPTYGNIPDWLAQSERK